MRLQSWGEWSLRALVAGEPVRFRDGAQPLGSRYRKRAERRAQSLTTRFSRFMLLTAASGALSLFADGRAASAAPAPAYAPARPPEKATSNESWELAVRQASIASETRWHYAPTDVLARSELQKRLFPIRSSNLNDVPANSNHLKGCLNIRIVLG